MPVPSTATEAEFQQASYMIEAVYRQGDQGVLMLMTTARSNRSGSPADWDVFLMPGAVAAAVLPYWTATGESRRIGALGDVDIRSVNVPSMREYIQLITPAQWYRVFVGYNPKHLTLDRRWYACDMYVQAPGMLYTTRYIWYILADCVEPSEYWRARLAWAEGMRDISFDDPLQVNDLRIVQYKGKASGKKTGSL